MTKYHCSILSELQELRGKMGRRQGNPDAREAFECLDTAISLYIHIQPHFHKAADDGKIKRNTEN